MIDNLLNELTKSESDVYIQTHDFPDPDAVSSAFALQNFLSSFKISAKIVYCGEIQRSALKKMIKTLNIELFNAKKVKIQKNDLIIIVDGCKWSKNVTDLEGFEIAVIDHHLVNDPDDVPYLQIEPETGASSTIITHYFMDKGMEIPMNVATALKVGISRDTDLLTRKVTEKDLSAFCYLYRFADNSMVNSLLRNNIQLSDFKYFNHAITSLHRKKEIAWFYYKDGCETNLMGIVGDFILSAQEIKLSILFANNDGTISISIRNEKPEWSAAQAVRAITKGVGAGGGHKEMAGGVIFSAHDFSMKKSIERVLELLDD